MVDAHFGGVERIDAVVRVLLEGHDVLLLTVVHALAHPDRLLVGAAAAEIVAEHPPHQTDLGRVQNAAVLRRDARAHADIDACGRVGVAGDVGIQGMDALHDDQLAGLAPERPPVKDAAAGLEIIAR